MEKLAINGGEKLIKNEFTPFNTYGPEEERAVLDVLKSGVLSKFLGEWGDDFFGGPKVREFEQKCEDYFSVKHAVTVNSWTSGLVAAVGAIDIEPGDEVIVTTMTMCASATAILHWNAIPVFADIDPETYNICTNSIEKNISPYTKAIMVADIFGQSADMENIMKIAKKNNLKVISDCAQGPGSLYKNKHSGTLADVGGFSLNYHKHIHTGEGGILVTDSDKIANKLRLIRNHGEAVIKSKGDNDLINIIGHNFRLGEIESALGIEQLKKLDKIIKKRQYIASRLRSGLKDLLGLNLPKIDIENTHVYYVFPMQIDESITKIHRNKIHAALSAEGLVVGGVGMVTHLLPIYQKKIAYGKSGFPWTSSICRREINYSKGICPIAEDIHENRILQLGLCSYDYSDTEIDLVIKVFHKVWNHLEDL